MKDEAVCGRVRSDLSARLDDEATRFDPVALQAHLDDCSECRSFETTQHSLRRMLRLSEIQAVPDVAPAVLRRIADDRSRSIQWFRVRLAGVAAVAAALVVLAATLPVLERSPNIANAQVITRRAFTAASSLDSYVARFDIVERGWHPEIPSRRFEADVWYRAPEEFRLQVRDLTTYPEGAWPRNDVELIAGPSRTWIQEPFSCPPQALPGCAISAGVEERTLVRRQPFDGTSAAPTDIVVPLESLATSDAFSVIDELRIGGREAIHVQLTYRQAFPLVDALQAGGSWTPLLPLDRVDVWLERDTWFPLAFEVTRPGMARPLLEVNASEVRTSGAVPGTIFEAPVGGSVRDGGFTSDRVPTDADRLTPDYVAGLPLYRSGRTADGRDVVAYASGLTYLTVSTGPQRSVALEDTAEIVDLDRDSVGFYRPARADSGRRVDVFGNDSRVRVETNLRRADAIKVAASLPITGVIPQAKQGAEAPIRLTSAELDDIPFAMLPSDLPPGYASFSASSTRTKLGAEVTIVYLPSESALEGSEIRLFQSTRVAMLPPTSEDLVGIRVADASGRWSRERGEIEWIGSDGVYRAITAPSFDLDAVADIAESLR